MGKDINVKQMPIKASKEIIDKYKIRSIKASDDNSNSSILGSYTGKCCDSNVFNNNDMHLPRELFEKLKESDEYKRAMANHHYIGFLGHPSDSDCQDYEHACIVMKDMRILDNSEIEGDFDLIDTPVGRIVKAFIDAGVNFGISIRGFGDVDSGGEVDPDQFIFRGFDLVTFPAYDDCIPEFKAIAASTDAKKKAVFKKVCAAIDTNLKDIKSCDALEFIKGELPEGSDEFVKISDRIDELQSNSIEEAVEESIDINEQKLEAMTELYLDAKAEARELEQKLTDLEVCNQDLVIECKTLKQKDARLKRIVANQVQDANDSIVDLQSRLDRSNNQIGCIKASLDSTKRDLKAKQLELDKMQDMYRAQVQAHNQIRDVVKSLRRQSNIDKNTIKASEDLNLKYQHKIDANSETIFQKDSEIEELKSKLNETVVASQRLESKASNLDEKNGELLSRVEAAEDMILSYQQAYADMYANALGVCLTGLPITASTSVGELKAMIKSGTSTANIASSPVISDQEVYDSESEDDDLLDDDINYSAGLVTM